MSYRHFLFYQEKGGRNGERILDKNQRDLVFFIDQSDKI